MSELRTSDVIKRPLITERGTHLTETSNAYLFEVDRNATKLDIRRAIEELFRVKVTGVRTMTVPGKRRRTRAGYITLPNWKKAIVRLEEGQRIEFI